MIKVTEKQRDTSLRLYGQTYQDAIAPAVRKVEGGYEVDTAHPAWVAAQAIKAAKAKNTPTTVPLAPIPYEDWPVWAKWLKRAFAKPEDVGIGSTIERTLGMFGKGYKSTLQAMGLPCGCADRKAEYDIIYRY